MQWLELGSYLQSAYWKKKIFKNKIEPNQKLSRKTIQALAQGRVSRQKRVWVKMQSYLALCLVGAARGVLCFDSCRFQWKQLQQHVLHFTCTDVFYFTMLHIMACFVGLGGGGYIFVSVCVEHYKVWVD